MNKKKYIINPLEWLEKSQSGLIATKDIHPFDLVNSSTNFVIRYRGENMILLDMYNEVHDIQSNKIEDAKKLAQKIWEKELLKILTPVNDVEIEILKHMNDWISNHDEMQLAVERIHRDTLMVLKPELIKEEIKAFTKNLISEAKTQMSVSDYRKYFFNVIKNKLKNNPINSSIERNR